jgi:MinD-like ATPase involved in chromosome partitioning or flagellar assembly
MSATPVPTVGVAGAPHVAAALRQIGFTVVTGATFRDAAIAIAQQLKQSKVHVVVESMTEPGFTPWVKATNTKSLGVILLPTDPSVDLTQLASIPTLALPATVNELLVQIGASPSLDDAGNTVIDLRGATAIPTPPPALPADPLAHLSAPAPAPAPATAPAPAAIPAPAAAPVIADPFAVLDGPVTTPAVTDPFQGLPFEAAAPAVSDPFAEAAAPFPSAAPVTNPFEGGSAASGDDAFALMLSAAAVVPAGDPADAAPTLGAPNPVPDVAAPAAADPFAPDNITGEADEEDDFLAGFVPPAATNPPAPSFLIPEPAPVFDLSPPAAPEPTFNLPLPTAATPEPEPTFDLPLPEVPVAPPASPAVPQALSRREARQQAQLRAEADVIPVPAPEPEPWAPSPAPVPADEPVPAQPVVLAPVFEPVPEVPDARTTTMSWIPEPAAVTPAPAPAPAIPDVDFFSGTGISAGGCQVIVSLAGKGGAGKTTQTLMYAQTGGSAGLRTLVIDANRDQGDIGTSLRIEKAGFPTVLQAVHGSPADAIVHKDAINAARPSASQDIEFDVILAPPREFAGPDYASATVYAKVLAYAKSKYDLVVIDTQIIEAHKSDLHLGFIIPELRSGAWSAGIATYDYSAIRNAFAVFHELVELGVTPQRTLVLATRWPERESDAERFISQFGHFGTFVGFVGDDPNVNAQKSVGNLLVGSPAVEPVVRTLLHRVTGNHAFAPIEETGRRRKKAPPAGAPAQATERRGLFGRRK